MKISSRDFSSSCICFLFVSSITPSVGMQTCFPMQLEPANFFVIRMGSLRLKRSLRERLTTLKILPSSSIHIACDPSAYQQSRSARKLLRVVLLGTLRYPPLNASINFFVNISSSSVHFPFRQDNFGTNPARSWF